jgi:hypothetical protein
VYRFSAVVAVVMLAIFATMVAIATAYPEKARFMPLVVGIPGIALCLLQLTKDLRAIRHGRVSGVVRAGVRSRWHVPGGPPELVSAMAEGPQLDAQTVVSEVKTWTYFVAFIAAVLLFGFHISVPILVAIYLRLEAKLRGVVAVLAAAIFTVVMHVMFERVLEFSLHDGFLAKRMIEAFGS